MRPERYRNAVVAHIYVSGASDGIAFYQRAFGAVELFRIAHPDGRILHAEISIGGSVVMIGDPDDKLYGEPRSVGRCTAQRARPLWSRLGAPPHGRKTSTRPRWNVVARRSSIIERSACNRQGRDLLRLADHSS